MPSQVERAGPIAASSRRDSLRSGQTQWSLVFNGASGTTTGQEALAELCLRFGYPVYAYLRRCGHAANAAASVLHGFFHHLDAPLPPGVPLPPSFRRWLLDDLHRFLAHPEQFDELLTVANLSPAELERRYLAEAEPGLAPHAAFHRDFAREVLARAQHRLFLEATQAGRESLYAHLSPFLAREPAPGQYEELATTLGSRPLALVTAVKRLRQRFRELVDAELAQTVAGPDDLNDERVALRGALAT
jgi:RNA polymerase sigma-70 factor (ECF subfamily)